MALKVRELAFILLEKLFPVLNVVLISIFCLNKKPNVAEQNLSEFLFIVDQVKKIVPSSCLLLSLAISSGL